MRITCLSAFFAALSRDWALTLGGAQSRDWACFQVSELKWRQAKSYYNVFPHKDVYPYYYTAMKVTAANVERIEI